MTRNDFAAFVDIFDRVAKGFQKRFEGGTSEARADDRLATQQVYFEALAEYPLESVVAAGRQLLSVGSTDNWFPRAPEWGQLAMEHMIEALESSPSRRLLAPAPEVIEEDLAAARRGHQQLLEDLRQRGWHRAAEQWEQIEPKHPSEDTRALHCLDCSDTGVVVEQGSKADCQCAQTNPAIQIREIKARKTALATKRARLANDMRVPGRQLLG